MGRAAEGLVIRPDRFAFGHMYTAVGARDDAFGRRDARRTPLSVGSAPPGLSPDLRHHESQQE